MSTWIGTLFGKARRGLRSEPKPPRGQRKPMVAVKSVGARIPFDGHLLDPAMRVVVVEDACWRAATECWRTRRPAWWRLGALRRWRAEGTLLRDKQARIRELMNEAAPGLAARP
jgi:hypothetical protein